MVVLCNNDGVSIVASLTSSVDKIPDNDKVEGCIHDDDKGLHCFYIPESKIVGDGGYCFPKPTYIYVHQNIMDKKIDDLSQKYIDAGRVEKKCALTPDVHLELLNCIIRGKYVKRGVKRLLEQKISELV